KPATWENRSTGARKEELRGDCHEGQPTRQGSGPGERSEGGAAGYARSSPARSTTFTSQTFRTKWGGNAHTAFRRKDG
ncbi:unnamed protein product, partial [Ascophyllum nodosum]